jgi:Txe/YoeB family toxin of Txe-Axe toxin-antitoxin module
MPPYEPAYSPTFLECLKKHSDKKDRIEKFVKRICDDPYYRSELLEKKRDIDLRGKRSRHLSGNLVFVYLICEECVRNDFKNIYNYCSSCKDEVGAKKLVFLAFAKHDDIYSKEWTSQ